jgi:COP9 signalosome complex subunit 4
VADIHAANKDHDLAAKILAKINLENAHRNVDADEKASVYVTIAEYWLTDGDAVNAETFINKSAHIMHLVKKPDIQLRYKVSHARIMDSKRRFLVAA